MSKPTTIQVKIKCFKGTCGKCDKRYLLVPDEVQFCGVYGKTLFQWENGRFRRLEKCILAEKKEAKK